MNSHENDALHELEGIDDVMNDAYGSNGIPPISNANNIDNNTDATAPNTSNSDLDSVRDMLSNRGIQSNQNPNQRNNTDSNEESFLSKHLDAIIAGAAGLFAGRFLSGGDSSSDSSDGGSSKIGFFGMIWLLIVTGLGLFLVMIMAAILMKTYNIESPTKGIEYFITSTSGKHPDGTDFKGVDPFVELPKEGDIRKETVELEYTRIDKKTIEVKLTEHMIVQFQHKAKSKRGFVEVEIEKDIRTDTILSYELLGEV